MDDEEKPQPTFDDTLVAKAELGRTLEVSLNEIYVFDAESLKFLCVNRGARQNLGYSIGELAELTPLDIEPSFTHQRFAELIEPLLTGAANIQIFETIHRRKDGTSYDVEAHLQLDTYHGRAAFVAIMLDITARKAAEASLREREELSRSILETAATAILTMGEDRRIESANPATEAMFGYTKEELIGQNIRMLMPSPYAAQHDGYVANYLQTGVAKIIGSGREVAARHKDGRVFPIDLAVAEMNLVGGRRLFTGIIRDLTQRKALEAKLLSISEDERKAIGREIHDDLCQRLFGAGCLAKVLQEKSADAPGELREGIAQLFDMITEANAHARVMARGLMPVTLEADGLMAALGELATSTESTCDIACRFHCDQPVLVDDNNTAVQIYRIAQEAVKNAAHHGTPKQIDITLSRSNSDIVLEVRDDGAGLPPVEARNSGMGLLTMGHRARSLGGDCEFHNHVGAVVTCTIPAETTSVTELT